jgi:zinc protease
VPDHDETLVTIATDREATRHVVQVEWKLPPQPDGTVGAYRASVLSSPVHGHAERAAGRDRAAGGPAVHRRRVEPRQPDPHARRVHGRRGVRNGGVEAGLEAILTEAERVARHGFTATELDRHRTNLLRAYERAYAERENSPSAGYAAEYTRVFLEGESMPGIAYEYELMQRLLPGVELDEVNALARQWMTDHSRVVVASGPDKAGVAMPGEAELAAAFRTAETASITAYADTLGSVPLVAAAPTPSPVVEETRIEEIGVTRWRLANGVQVVLKPTDFKADDIQMRARSPGGTSLAPDSIAVSADRASMIVSASGAGAFSDVDLGKLLSGKVARAAAFIGDHDEGFSGNASPRDLETMLQLVYLYGTQPRRDSAAFASLQRRLLSFAQNRGQVPEAAFGDTLLVTVAGHHPARPPADGRSRRCGQPRRGAGVLPGPVQRLRRLHVLLRRESRHGRPAAAGGDVAGRLPSTGRQETWRDLGIRPPTASCGRRSTAVSSRRPARRSSSPDRSSTAAAAGTCSVRWARRSRSGCGRCCGRTWAGCTASGSAHPARSSRTRPTRSRSASAGIPTAWRSWWRRPSRRSGRSRPPDRPTRSSRR